MTSTTTPEGDFVGAKAAFFCGDRVLVLLRDDRPGLHWPGYWDLPGGAREADETAEACLLRELHEEVGLDMRPERLEQRWILPSILDPARSSAFFRGRLDPAEIAQIRLGDEGQAWAMMTVTGFLARPDVVPQMQARVRLALGS